MAGVLRPYAGVGVEVLIEEVQVMPGQGARHMRCFLRPTDLLWRAVLAFLS